MARYTDSLLMDGEHVLYRTRQHPLGRIVSARWGIVMVGIALAALIAIFIGNVTGTARDLLGWATLVLLVVGAVSIVWVYLHWWAEDYAVTNRRILKVEGLLNKKAADSGLEKINDAILEQSVFGRMLGYGDLDILTANEQSVDRYRMLSQAQTFKRTMLDEKHKLEQESFQIPAPPLRASAPIPEMVPVPPTPAPAAPAPAAPAEPVEPAEREMSSEEITRALGDLADLRDRGAITPEEYEAKKAELLERL